ncbi:class I SAM-dependent methyltransferase [Pendulispora brunnea]|uniref:Class I SAM-dependent methyltransferase n=1 Tax=Pendulispora brunnea TaxID=2905690 RepID=A0ABZ2K3S4_9BACT
MLGKQVVRDALGRHLPLSLRLFRSIRRIVADHTRSPEQVFSEVHRTNAWGDSASLSGGGSNLVESEAIREALPSLLHELGIRTLLDAPCGDFFWMRHSDLAGVHYIGVDVVAKLIEDNQVHFGSPNRQFLHRDLTRDELPRADLVFCRDCLIHLSYRHIHAVLRNFKATGARYLLTTQFPLERINHDIVTGSYRPINLCLDPFGFPEPLRILRDGPATASLDTTGQTRVLALWDLNQLPS